MSRSRVEMGRRRKAQRRRRLLAANAALLLAIGLVALWNVWASSAERDGVVSTPAPSAAAPSGADGSRGGAAESTNETDAGSPNETDAGTSDETETETRSEAEAETPGEADEPGTARPPSDETDSDAPPAVSGAQVTFAFVGDVLLGETVGTMLEQRGYDYPYEHVADLLRGADIAGANLETAVAAAGEKRQQKQYEFRSDPKALPAFREAGFDIVSLANNHSMDFGAEGLRETMRHLEANEIAHVGAGENAEEAYAPRIFERNGLRVAVLGFSRVIPDVSWKAGRNNIGLAESYDYRMPVEAIENASAEADIVVVFAHWGDEGVEEAHPQEQIELARRYVDAGADIVVGTHPHVLQGFEHYNGGWIAYSLGNFIFTKSKDPLTYNSGILEASCGADGECGLKFTPLYADTPQPQPMDEEKRRKLLARLDELSVGATVTEEGYIVAKETE